LHSAFRLCSSVSVWTAGGQLGACSCEKLVPIRASVPKPKIQVNNASQQTIDLSGCPSTLPPLLSLPFLYIKSFNPSSKSSTYHKLQATLIFLTCLLTPPKPSYLLNRKDESRSVVRTLSPLTFFHPKKQETPSCLPFGTSKGIREEFSCAEQKSTWTSTLVSRSPSASSRPRTGAAPSRPPRLTSRLSSIYHKPSSGSDGKVNPIPLPRPKTIDIAKRESASHERRTATARAAERRFTFETSTGE
jgi:hypothetical protein